MTDTRRSLKNSGKNGTAGKAEGELKIIRPSKLAAEGTTGLVAQGVYEKSEPNKFNPAKKDYFIRDTQNDTLYILNSTQVLADQMEQLDPKDGTEVEVVYGGMGKSKAGKSFHNWEVFVKA